MVAKAEFKLPELLSSDEIKQDQDGIRKDLTGLDQRVHLNAIQCLMHCEKHRDTSLMVRLLMEIIDGDTTGYRRQGLIAWMKYYTPMRLKGKTIDMSGKKVVNNKEVEHPFDVETAARTPFWKLTREAPAELRPMYQQGIMSAVDRAVKQFEDAVANTGENGQPIDKTKPFYKGKNKESLTLFAQEVKKLKAVIPSDPTKDIDEAMRKQALNVEQAAA